MKCKKFVELYKGFMKDLPWPVCIQEVNGNILYINEVFENIFHISYEKIISKNFYEDLKIEGLREFNDKVKDKKLTANKIKIESNIYDIYRIPLKDNDDVYAICDIFIDITEKVNKEDQLSMQTSLLRTMVDSLPEIVFFKDKEGKFVDYNTAFKKYCNDLGVDSRREMTCLEIYEDKELIEEIANIEEETMSTRKVKFYEQRIKDKFGKVMIKECMKAPVIDEYEGVQGVVGLVRDITERKKSEKRLRYLSEVDALTNLYNRYSFEEKIKELNKEEYLPLGIIMGDVNGLKVINDTFGHLEGDKLIVNAADILKEICGEYIFRWGGDEFIVLLPNFDDSKCEDIIRDIQKRCKEVKHDYIQVNIALGNIVKKSIDEDIYECIKNVEKKVYSQKLVENKSVKDSIINSLKKNLENKSYETSEHANRVANYAIEIGKRLNFRVSEMDELIASAQLHDIGKIAIDEYILKKPSKLTDEEYEIIKTHCENGYRIINASSGLETVAKCVLSHHERWDGNGYPFGLTGEEIPLISRIISVADSYDVMTSNRPYNKPLKHEEAMKELERCAGSQFDPNIVREFKLLVENNALLDINI